jgi:hypothetical protein
VPSNEVHETSDGKTIRIEYREENGIILKVFVVGRIDPCRLCIDVLPDDENLPKSKAESVADRGRTQSEETRATRHVLHRIDCD